jgi:uncharacterized protein YjbJ (UPF0337 family)
MCVIFTPSKSIQLYARPFNGELIMNKEQIKGVSKDVAGKIQEGAGKLTDNKSQQAKGLLKQVEGKAEKALGDVKAAIKK